jgi:hypothetical protein
MIDLYSYSELFDHTAPSQAALFLSSSCTRDQITAASICCSEYEKNIIPSLCGRRRRAIPKLTLSERARITNTFFLTWPIILGSPFDSYQERIERHSPRDVLYVRELAMFIINNLDNWTIREIQRLMGNTELEDVRERCIELLEASGNYFKGVCNGPWIPEYAPAGLGMLIDDYQKDYVEDYAFTYYQNLRWRRKEEEERGSLRCSAEICSEHYSCIGK